VHSKRQLHMHRARCLFSGRLIELVKSAQA
jgi:hypothetical protein